MNRMEIDTTSFRHGDRIFVKHTFKIPEGEEAIYGEGAWMIIDDTAYDMDDEHYGYWAYYEGSDGCEQHFVPFANILAV